MPDRPTGRPPLQRGDPSVSVCIRLPGSQYDVAYHRAAAEGVSVPELLRRECAAAFQPPGEDDDSDD